MQPIELDKQAAIEESHWWFEARRSLLASGLEHIEKGGNARILEIGAATGGNHQICGQFGIYYALDLSPHALSVCRTKGIQNLVQGNGRSIPFDEASFDAVVAFDILEHIEEDHEAIEEIFRVLKPGGIFIVNVPAFQWMFSDHDRAFEHVRRYKPRELEAKIENAGFKIDYRSYWSFFIFPAVALVRLLAGFWKSEKGDQTDFDRQIPKIAELVLSGLSKLELILMRCRLPLPVGISLYCLSRKS